MDEQGNRFFGGGQRKSYHHGSLKDALLEAARALVAERGPAGFTLAEAAKRVGVTAAAPYRHFTDRSALMSELAARGFQLFGDQLAAAYAEGRPDAATAMRRMGAAYLQFARSEPGLYAAMFSNVRSLDAPESGAAADRALELLRRASAAMLAEAGAPQGDAKALAFEIWAMSHGVAMLSMSGYLNPTRPDADPVAILDAGARAIVVGAIMKAKGVPIPDRPPSAGAPASSLPGLPRNPWSR